MCIKTIYRNTYIDGSKDVSDHVDFCGASYPCLHPAVREVSRTLPFQRGSSSPRVYATAFDRMPSPMFGDSLLFPPTPRSMSPPATPASGERRMAYRTSGSGSGNGSGATIYVNGARVDAGRSRDNRRSDRLVVVEPTRHRAPTPPSPRVFASSPGTPSPQRSPTFPYTVEASPRDERRGRAEPVIIEERRPRPSGRRGSDVLYSTRPEERRHHSSSPVTIHRPHGLRNAALESAYHTFSRSPLSAAQWTTADQERRERRKAQKAAAAAAAIASSSAAVFGSSDGSTASAPAAYDTTYYSSRRGSDKKVSPSPAVTATKKTLRWEDELRAAQNEKIAARPKLTRSQSVNAAGGKVQGEVRKSILKNASTGSSSTRAADDIFGPPLVHQAAAAAAGGDYDYDYEGLHDSMRGLGIREDPARMLGRQVRQRERELRERERAAAAAAREAREVREYDARLRSRFERSPASAAPGGGTAGGVGRVTRYDAVGGRYY